LNGDVATLTEPEKFAVRLQRIPDFRGKVRGMIELHLFDIAFDLLNKLDNATNLRCALAVVLQIGNALNG
jgi:hypothetical protein